jgi:peptidyl-prolyl cis-trans isomerase A (cyclophilin A)
MKRITVTICGLLMLAAPLALADTFVHVETRMGAMDFQLFDDLAPITVANFLNYVNSGDFDYDGTFFHRSVPGFVIQGGGFTYGGLVPEDPPIPNEFDPATMSNTRGTLAMARGDTLDSATSQWFINLADNDILDDPANPYCVFGTVVKGMVAVADEIALLPVEDMSILYSAFGELPMIDYTPAAPGDPFNPVLEENLVTVFSVRVFTPRQGDANLDDYVGPLDYMAWTVGYEPGSSGKHWGNGDFTGDGVADGLDYVDWSNNYQQGTPPTPANVPEPASALLLILGVGALIRRRRGA